MNELHKQYLQAMGVSCWVSRDAQPPAAGLAPAKLESTRPGHTISATPAATAVPAAARAPDKHTSIATLDWPVLQQQVADCRLCGLQETRTQTVFGTGNTNADWLIVGEAPGADEDRQGEPFVGRAGQLLNSMLLAVGLQRPDVYIANILKCRPPGNRDPAAAEVLHCEPYLARQIELIRPKLILALGRIAAQNLLKVDTPVARLRGRVHEYGEGSTPLVVTYHPAYLLRAPEQKARAWQDLQLAMSLVS